MAYCDTYDDNSEDSQPVNNDSEEVTKLIVILWTLLMSVAYQDSDLETVTVTCSCKTLASEQKVVPAKLPGFSAVLLADAAASVPLVRIR